MHKAQNMIILLTSTQSDDSEVYRCLTGMHRNSRLTTVLGNPFAHKWTEVYCFTSTTVRPDTHTQDVRTRALAIFAYSPHNCYIVCTHCFRFMAIARIASALPPQSEQKSSSQSLWIAPFTTVLFLALVFAFSTFDFMLLIYSHVKCEKRMNECAFCSMRMSLGRFTLLLCGNLRADSDLKWLEAFLIGIN